MVQIRSFHTIPIHLQFNRQSHLNNVAKLSSPAALHRLVSHGLRAIPLPPSNLILAAGLTRLLKIRMNSQLAMRILRKRHHHLAMPITKLISRLINLTICVSVGTLGALLQRKPAISKTCLGISPLRDRALCRRLGHAPTITDITRHHATLRRFRSAVTTASKIVGDILVLFTYVVTITIICGTTHVTLSRHDHRLTALQVVNFARHRVTFVLLNRRTLLALATVPIN